MTHKYLGQIRTIPNYHENQTSSAKAFRGLGYNIKSTANYIIKNKKTRVIASVLCIYGLITSSFMVNIINTSNNQALAASTNKNNQISNVASSKPTIKIENIKTNSDDINLELIIQNPTKQNHKNITLELPNSSNIKWILANDILGSQILVNNENNFIIPNIDSSSSMKYSIKGKFTNSDSKEVTIVGKILDNNLNIKTPIQIITKN